MSIEVQNEDFNVGTELAALSAGRTDVGAVASFVGMVRDVCDAGAIVAMTLEHYPGMTEKALAAIESEARARWPIQAVRIVHRIGRLLPGERIVFVGVAAPHRGAAFEACEFIMDYLKTQAPFWKKEETVTGAHWVDAREEDSAAAIRWRSAPA